MHRSGTVFWTAGHGFGRGGTSIAELKQQVADTERAFAATMKARDHAGFVGFLAEDAIFFNGKQVQHASRKWRMRGSGCMRSGAPFSGAGRGRGARLWHAGACSGPPSIRPMASGGALQFRVAALKRRASGASCFTRGQDIASGAAK